MAIYSLHHRPIGKSTQAEPFTAAAHINYITRSQAMSHLEAARFADASPKALADAFRQMEASDRKNARVADKVMLALPVELSAQERVQLMRAYAEDVTGGRAAWVAAFHDKGKDARNPHCHLVIRDRDPTTGRRVIGMSEAGSTDRLRLLWETHANAALERAGRPERIDRRTLAAQGITRVAEIHEGPTAQALDRKRLPARSKAINARNGRGAKSRERVVDFRRIDGGRSRTEHNRRLRGRETTGDYWAALDAENLRLEMDGLRAIHKPSMEGVVPVPLNQREIARIHGVPFGGLLSTPGRAPRLSLGPTALEPAPDGIGKRGDESAKPNLEKRNDPVGNIVHARDSHKSSIGDKAPYRKGFDMELDEERSKAAKLALDEARAHADQKQARYEIAMEKSYLDPKKAEKNMENYRRENGDAKLYEKLQGNPRKTEFGLRPGSILNKDGYTAGATERRENSINARKALPEATREHLAARDRLAGAERAHQNVRGPDGPTGPQPGTQPSGEGHEHAKEPGLWHQRKAEPGLTPGTSAGPAKQPGPGLWHAAKASPTGVLSPENQLAPEHQPKLDKGRGR